MGSVGGNNLLSKINALEVIAMSSVRTPLNIVSRQEGMEVQEYWDRVNPGEEQLSSLPIESVDFNELYTWQRVVDSNGLRRMANSDTPHSSDYPIAVEYNGKLILVDGNHRAALDKLKGKQHIQVRVYRRR